MSYSKEIIVKSVDLTPIAPLSVSPLPGFRIKGGLSPSVLLDTLFVQIHPIDVIDHSNGKILHL
jgi:hypothetical protein